MEPREKKRGGGPKPLASPEKRRRNVYHQTKDGEFIQSIVGGPVLALQKSWEFEIRNIGKNHHPYFIYINTLHLSKVQQHSTTTLFKGLLLSFSPWRSAVSARCPSHAPKGVRRGATDMRELGGTWRWRTKSCIASDLIWIVLKCHLEWFTFSGAFARQRSSKNSMFHLAKGIKWFSFSWHGSAQIFTVSLGGLEIGAEIQVSSLTFERGHNGRMMLDTLCFAR